MPGHTEFVRSYKTAFEASQLLLELGPAGTRDRLSSKPEHRFSQPAVGPYTRDADVARVNDLNTGRPEQPRCKINPDLFIIIDHDFAWHHRKLCLAHSKAIEGCETTGTTAHLSLMHSETSARRAEHGSYRLAASLKVFRCSSFCDNRLSMTSSPISKFKSHPRPLQLLDFFIEGCSLMTRLLSFLRMRDWALLARIVENLEKTEKHHCGILCRLLVYSFCNLQAFTRSYAHSRHPNVEQHSKRLQYVSTCCHSSFKFCESCIDLSR